MLGLFFFFFNDTATTEIYTLSLHDALPICPPSSTPERLPAMDQSRIASLARTGQDSSPRLRDLSICSWDLTAPSPIKRPSARANHLPFAIWQLPWIHRVRRLWMTMA